MVFVPIPRNQAHLYLLTQAVSGKELHERSISQVDGRRPRTSPGQNALYQGSRWNPAHMENAESYRKIKDI